MARSTSDTMLVSRLLRKFVWREVGRSMRSYVPASWYAKALGSSRLPAEAVPAVDIRQPVIIL